MIACSKRSKRVNQMAEKAVMAGASTTGTDIVIGMSTYE
jgi:hypothetical protein